MNFELSPYGGSPEGRGLKEKATRMKIWEHIFLLFLFLLPWQTRLIVRHGVLNNGNWEYGIIGIYGTEILLWLVVAIFCAGFRVKRGMTFLVAILLLFFINIFFATDKVLALQSWRYIFEAIVVFFLIQKHSRRDWLIWSFLAGLSIQSILAIWQFLSQSAFTSRWLGLALHPAWQAGSAVLENTAGRWLRAYGGLPHPNILGGYLVVGLMVIVTLLHCYIVRKWRKILFLILYSLFFTALFFTFSRSAWTALFIGLLVFWFMGWRKKIIFKSFNLLIFLSFLFFILYSLFFWPLVSGRLNVSGRLEAQSATERLTGYAEAWQLFKKHPFLGVGLGNYTLAVQRELDSSRPSWTYQPAHNVIVLALAEIGVVGFVLFIMGFFIVSVRNHEKKGLFFILYSLFFILAMFDHYLWSLYSGWMLLAAGGGLAIANFKEIL